MDRGSQFYVPDKCGPGNAIAFVQYGNAGAHKFTTGNHFDSGERFAQRDQSPTEESDIIHLGKPWVKSLNRKLYFNQTKPPCPA
jgi:hypothetical protein